MKYITFAVPCYNSENYMRRCVDSLLIGGKDVEIILIDDGSSDRTAQIADEYEINTRILYVLCIRKTGDMVPV